MDGETERAAYPGHSAQGIGARAEVADGAKKFEAVALFLQRIGLGIGPADHLDRLGPNFHGLALGGRGHEFAADPQRAAGGQPFDLVLVVGQGRVGEHLYAGQAGAVTDLKKGQATGIAAGAQPAADFDSGAHLLAAQDFGNSRRQHAALPAAMVFRIRCAVRRCRPRAPRPPRCRPGWRPGSWPRGQRAATVRPPPPAPCP